MAALVVLIAAGLGAWQWRASASRARWARTVAAPEIQRLSNRGDDVDAFFLARQALDRRSRRSAPAAAVARCVDPGGDDDRPGGSGRRVRRVPDARRPGFPLGRTPLKGVRIPRALVRVRISKDGFQPIEGSGSPALERYRLDPVDAGRPGMVRVVGGRDPVRFGAVGEIDDFWIDRFEVTNREFKAFVDQGGYRKPRILARAIHRRWTIHVLAGGGRAIS